MGRVRLRGGSTLFISTNCILLALPTSGGQPHTAGLMVLSVPLLVGLLPNSRAGKQTDSWSTGPHPPVHVQDAVGITVHHMDEQLCLCEVHPTPLVHVELGEKEHPVCGRCKGWAGMG